MTEANELSLVDGLAQLSFLVHGTIERRANEHDVSMILTRLLGILRDREPGVNELARLLALDKSSVSGLIDRAERRGLVERVRSEVDRRAVQVRLTTQGRAIVSDVAERVEADVSSIVASLSSKERVALTDLVSRVLVAEATRRGVDLFAPLQSE